MLELLTVDHFDRILDLFDETKQEIKIISPFLTMSMAEKLCQVVSAGHLHCTFITRFYLEDMIAKANSMDALELMMDHGINVYAVKKLHTKLYLFDQTAAVLGSANFTNGGFKSNIELSILLHSESELLGELQEYFDHLLEQVKAAGNGLVTKDTLSEARNIYANLWSVKKGSGTTRSGKMFGATLNKSGAFGDSNAIVKELDACVGEKDLIVDLFKHTENVEQIHYQHNLWLKFDGEGNDRMEADEGFPMTPFQRAGKTLYLSNYPFKVSSIRDGDEIYFAALTTDTHGKNQPVIVGRGYLESFTEKNNVDEAMLQQYSWMSRYPWYCVIRECEILDTPVKNGIPMDSIWEALGSDTYIASFGRNEGIAAVARKHHQKAHIRLSGNAKVLIDKKFEVLKATYGVIPYRSES